MEGSCMLWGVFCVAGGKGGWTEPGRRRTPNPPRSCRTQSKVQNPPHSPGPTRSAPATSHLIFLLQSDTPSSGSGCDPASEPLHLLLPLPGALLPQLSLVLALSSPSGLQSTPSFFSFTVTSYHITIFLLPDTSEIIVFPPLAI